MKTALIVAALATAGFVGLRTADCGGPCILSAAIAALTGECDGGPTGDMLLAEPSGEVRLVSDVPFSSTGSNDCGGLIGASCTDVADAIAAAPVHGDYIEARSAAVFAGACHVNGEYDLTGRQALVALSLDGGTHGGVDLAGVDLVVAVASDRNLAEDGERSAEVYLPASLDDAVADAAMDWLRATHGATFGRLEAVAADVRVARDGDAFEVSVDGRVALTGTALEDRACCAMPESVWYRPLLATEGAVVGLSETCRFEGGGRLDAWAYQNQNNAFVGRF